MFNFPTKLTWLNHGNETVEVQYNYCMRLLDQFPNEEITALEVGSAFGGGVEMMGKIFSGKGKVYGFDTFEGHPKDLADDPNDKEAWCMDEWYNIFGWGPVKIEYQRKVLADEGLKNVTLVKGRVNKNSFKDIDKIHFCLMDLDLIKSTRSAYEGIKDKFVKGAYFIMHDSLPADHLPMIHDFVYKEMLNDGWELEHESYNGLSTVLKRK